MAEFEPPTWKPGRGLVRAQILVLTCGLVLTVGVALLNLATGDGGKAVQFFVMCFIYLPGLLISVQQWRRLQTRSFE